MKKISILAAVSLLTPGLFAQTRPLSQQLKRAVAQAVAQQDANVAVLVKLEKPVYMSDVMYRPVRGKDRVIGVDYKQKSCTGHLSEKQDYVSVPAACIQDGLYAAAQVTLSFANGQKVTKSGNAVHVQKGKTAFIYL